MKISFYTEAFAKEMTDNYKGALTFGGRTADLAGAEQRDELEFPVDLEGVAFSGTYAECLRFASDEKNRPVDVKAVIAITDDPGEENHFIQKLYEITQCPIVGGGAARNGGTPGQGFIAQRGRNAEEKNDGESTRAYSQATVFLITDDSVEITTEVCNIHDQIIETCKLELLDPRTIDKINGVDAVTYLKELKASHGFAETDFEHLTLSTMDHINAHLSLKDGKVFSGRDLDEEMIVRYVDAASAHDKIEKFYTDADADAIVFGCAGLGTLLERRFACRCFGTFLYGEICYTGERSDFGNLMLSKMRFRRN